MLFINNYFGMRHNGLGYREWGNKLFLKCLSSQIYDNIPIGKHDFDSDSNYSIYKIKVYDVRSPDIPRIKSIVCDKSYIVSKTSDVLNSLFI